MHITRIESFRNNKIKIHIDGELKFWLYKKDLKRYTIEEDAQLSPEEYDVFYKLNLQRGKKQVLNLLQRMDKTRQEVIRKLQESGYCEEIIYDIMKYIDSYNYLDDDKYARQYIRYKRESKSKREIERTLIIKGVSKDIIGQAISEEYGSEDEAIKKAIKKKNRSDNCDLSQDDLQKLMVYLYNRGFNMDIIRKHINIDKI